MGAGAFGERDDWLRLNTATTCTSSLPMGSLPATLPLAPNPGLKDGPGLFPSSVLSRATEKPSLVGPASPP